MSGLRLGDNFAQWSIRHPCAAVRAWFIIEDLTPSVSSLAFVCHHHCGFGIHLPQLRKAYLFFWNADPSIPGPETGDGDILLLLRAVKEVEWSTPNDVTGLHRWGRLLEHALTALYTVRRSHQAGSFLKEISAIVRVICQSLSLKRSRHEREALGRDYFAPEPASRTRPRRILWRISCMFAHCELPLERLM